MTGGPAFSFQHYTLNWLLGAKREHDESDQQGRFDSVQNFSRIALFRFNALVWCTQLETVLIFVDEWMSPAMQLYGCLVVDVALAVYFWKHRVPHRVCWGSCRNLGAMISKRYCTKCMKR